LLIQTVGPYNRILSVYDACSKHFGSKGCAFIIFQALDGQSLDNVVNCSIGRSTYQNFSLIANFPEIVVLGRKEPHQSRGFSCARRTLKKNKASLSNHHVSDRLPLCGIVYLVELSKDRIDLLSVRYEGSQLFIQDGRFINERGELGVGNVCDS